MATWLVLTGRALRADTVREFGSLLLTVTERDGVMPHTVS